MESKIDCAGMGHDVDSEGNKAVKDSGNEGPEAALKGDLKAAAKEADKKVRRELTLVEYFLFSLIHLIPIEIIFAYLAHYYPLWESSLVFIDIMYFIIVGIVGVIHLRKRIIKSIIDATMRHLYKELDMAPVDIKPFVQAGRSLKPYMDALDKNKDKLKLSPDEMISLLGKIKEMADGHGNPGPGTTVTGESTKADIQKELQG